MSDPKTVAQWLRNEAKVLRDPKASAKETDHIVSAPWTFSQRLDDAAAVIEGLLQRERAITATVVHRR